MGVYLVGLKIGKEALTLASQDPDSRVVLLQDGLYLDVSVLGEREIYAIEEEVRIRGLEALLPENVKRISYGDLLELIVQNKVFNFA